MAFNILKGNKNSVIGIDLGSASIKVVELSKEANRPRLVTFGLAAKDRKDIKNDTVSSTINVITDLKHVLSQARTHSDKIVAAIPAANVFSTIVSMPKMPIKEIDSAIKWEAKKLLPLSLDKMSLNWHIIPDNPNQPAEDQKKIRIIISAAPKEIINYYLEIFKQTNLHLLSLETEIKALQRSLLPNDEQTYLIVDIGATNTNMIVFDKNLPVINRNVNFGSEILNHTIANTLNVDLERAEQSKNTFGLPLDDQDTHPVVKAMRFTIDNLVVQEIKRLIVVLQNTTKTQINNIVVTGGGAHLKNLAPYLKHTLEIETSLGDPWKNIIYPEELKAELSNIAPEMSVAIGLALKGVA